ncbi:hypothetical protein [Pseudogemmobacter sonorensis]|uniref:hypothetical protein n=1 Tax=Pseudogemmobacter sonorensis TaxID=2989681 RepID=UPI0036C2FA36
MLVFWEARLVFLATPKTGSTAIAEALESRAAISVQRPPLLKHTTVHRFRRFLGPYLEAASKDEWCVVALMREPRDWLGSWYRFRQRPDQTDARKSTRGMDFDSFVEAWCAPTRPAFADVGSQARFLRPRQGQGVDRLFRYEDMAGFTAFLAERLDGAGSGPEAAAPGTAGSGAAGSGVAGSGTGGIALPRVNVSPEADLALSPATEARLREVAAEDFALYESLGPEV